MRKSIVVIVALAAVFVFATGCTKKSTNEPSKLMGKLYSGESLQAVQRKLDIVAAGWELVEDRHSLPDSPPPPWRSLVIRKRGYPAYGQTGDLELSFFNDELVSVQFYPRDVVTAAQSIAARDGVGFSPAGDAKISVSTRIWIGKDAQGRGYIGWIDKTRQELRDRAVQ